MYQEIRINSICENINESKDIKKERKINVIYRQSLSFEISIFWRLDIFTLNHIRFMHKFLDRFQSIQENISITDVRVIPYCPLSVSSFLSISSRITRAIMIEHDERWKFYKISRRARLLVV